VPFTATVTPSTGPVPTGTVQFRDGATNLGSLQTVNGSAQATLSTSALTLGPHSITAVYSGDGTYSGSTSSAVTQNVNPGTTPTNTGAGASAKPATAAQSVT